MINLNYCKGEEINKMKINTSEKSEQIQYIQWNLYEINKVIECLTEESKTNNSLFNEVKKEILDLIMANNYLIIELSSIQDEIRETLLSKNPNWKVNLQEKNLLIKQKENEIQSNKIKIDILSQRLDNISTEISNIKIAINQKVNDKMFFSCANQLINFIEPYSDVTINDLVIKPEWIKEFVESYWKKDFPQDLLDKVVFFKWDKNTGKLLAIKAIANELNRPLFRIKYDNYFDEQWLYSIFWLITSYLRQQRDEKNNFIEYYNEKLEQIKEIKQWIFNENSIYNVLDIEWNNHTFDLKTQDWKLLCLEKLNDLANEAKVYIDAAEDSCILYVDDLDRIIQSSIYEKWELLWSIKMVISDIKNEAHDVMLVLAGNNLWTNHNDFKLWIDRVFQFGWIEKNYQKTFEKMLQKKLEKLDIQTNIWTFSLNNLEKNYINIKFLDKLVKRIIKNYILNKKIITQEIFDLELHNLIEWEKSLNNWISLK